MRAEVIAIGDELTTGQRLDTNSQWLSTELTALGFEVAFHSTVGDDIADNVAVFRHAIQRAEIIVMTGGLGPTADDLTRNALAEVLGVQLVRNEESLTAIRNLFTQRGREMPERNVVQAEFPAGAKPIPNLNGTAPGIELHVDNELGKCALYALPGVPAEMHEMWQDTVVPSLRELQPESRVICHRRIKCFGVGESELEAMLPDLVRRGRQPRVGITASHATITLRITASGATEEEARQDMEPTAATIYETLGSLVFGEEDEQLEDVVLKLLAEKKESLAVAEWATEGQVTTALQEAKANESFLGGITLGSKADLAALVAADQLVGSETASSETASALAESARQRFGSSFGLGIASFPDKTENPTARVHVSLAAPDGLHKWRFGCASHPAIKISRTTKQALNATRLHLQKNQA